MFRLRAKPEPGSLAAALTEPAPSPCLFWLGQAGFALRYGDRLALIDPYLSDALAEKYVGTALPHTRMMAAPIRHDELPRVDFVLVTHRHGDHLDRKALPEIAMIWPECRIVAPAAEMQVLLDLGVAGDQLVATDAGQALDIVGATIHPVPAAHEALERDAHGHHRYLGYVVTLPEVTFYHSGDCIPFAGLGEALEPHRIDLALLPVNGRDAARLRQGIPGNFTLAEASALCREQAIPEMIAHHYGMFDFNTITREDIEAEAARVVGVTTIVPASLHTRYTLESATVPARTAMMVSG